MEKRTVSMFAFFIAVCIALVVRLAVIQTGSYSVESANNITSSMVISQSRGMIYDRNMIPLVNTHSRTVLALNPTPSGLNYAKKYLNIGKKSSDRFPMILECEDYDGKCDDIIKLTVYDRYSPDDCAVNLIGYTDSGGAGVCGVEKAFDKLLTDNGGTLKISYTTDAYNRILSGDGIRVVDNGYASKGGISLTIDSAIQRICEKSLDDCGITVGAAVVLDARTSEILALVTAPSIDRTNLASSVENENSPFINRAVTAYSVGSVFKSVVAAAAVDRGISTDRKYKCDGYIDVGENRFNCHASDGHGTVNMTDAVAGSCNAYFIDLGLETGAGNILKTASLLGLGRSVTLADGIESDAGYLPSADEIDSPSALANLSFGQGTLLATPLQMAAVYAAFANGGYYREPYLLKEIIDPDGKPTAYYKSEINDKVLADSTCEKIRKMLEETVERGSGSTAKPKKYTAAGKTATAQTGWYENGEEVLHTWFAGYFPADEPRYVIVVMNENGSFSSSDCAPAFKSIADGITDYYER